MGDLGAPDCLFFDGHGSELMFIVHNSFLDIVVFAPWNDVRRFGASTTKTITRFRIRIVSGFVLA